MLHYLYRRIKSVKPEPKLDDEDTFETVEATKVQAVKFRMTVLPSSPLRMDARSKGLFTALKTHGILLWEPQPNVFLLQAIGADTTDYRVIHLYPKFGFRHSKFEYWGNGLQVQDYKNHTVPPNEFLHWIHRKSKVKVSAERGTIVFYTTLKQWVMYVDQVKHTIEFR